MKPKWTDTPEDPDLEPSEEDREFLDPIENASELYDRYLDLSRLTTSPPMSRSLTRPRRHPPWTLASGIYQQA